MLLLFRPFRHGDSIEVAGKKGTVKDLNLFMTELEGEEQTQILVPNAQVWGAAIVNYTAYNRRPNQGSPGGPDR
jgi:small conductance mechanosensitive channel